MKRVKILKAAIAEAVRFIERANAAIDRLESEQKMSYKPYQTKETGAVKRAAIDLKRELTNVTQMTALED